MRVNVSPDLRIYKSDPVSRLLDLRDFTFCHLMLVTEYSYPKDNLDSLK